MERQSGGVFWSVGVGRCWSLLARDKRRYADTPTRFPYAFLGR
jgi:hypothetical protein